MLGKLILLSLLVNLLFMIPITYYVQVQVQAQSTLIWKGGDSLLKCRPHCDWTIYLIDLFS